MTTSKAVWALVKEQEKGCGDKKFVLGKKQLCPATSRHKGHNNNLAYCDKCRYKIRLLKIEAERLEREEDEKKRLRTN